MEKNQNYRILISSFKCENCNFHSEKTDDIDSSLFLRNEECQNYSAKMKRWIKGEKIIIEITIECNICHNFKKDNFKNKENKLEFQCCKQQKFVVSYYISNQHEDSIIDDNLLNNNNIIDDDNISNNYYNNKNINNITNENKYKYNNDNDNDNDNGNDNDNNIYIKNIDIYPWSNIAIENKIILVFKYYKRTGVNYFLHCSKKSYFADVIKELIKECDIDNRIIFAACDAKQLDGEKTIEELKLKNKALILLR